MQHKLFFLGLLIISFTILTSCSDNSQTAIIRVSLVDAPADYDAVYIDIQDVQINTTTNAEDGWISLDGSVSGIYDLLKLTDGQEAFLGEIELPEGNLSQVRLILGAENKLVIGENEHNLTVPSGSQSGLKLNIHTAIEAGISYKLIIDFDAGRSVVKAGNSGIYHLKPVIRAQMEAQSGAVEGVISPADVKCIIYAIKNTDSTSTYPDQQGEFLIRALESGTYEIHAITATTSNFTSVFLENINVTVGEITKLDTIKFQQ